MATFGKFGPLSLPLAPVNKKKYTEKKKQYDCCYYIFTEKCFIKVYRDYANPKGFMYTNISKTDLIVNHTRISKVSVMRNGKDEFWNNCPAYIEVGGDHACKKYKVYTDYIDELSEFLNAGSPVESQLPPQAVEN
eukprot:Pgem_evm1s11309